jgi:hypothetical protein
MMRPDDDRTAQQRGGCQTKVRTKKGAVTCTVLFKSDSRAGRSQNETKCINRMLDEECS